MAIYLYSEDFADRFNESQGLPKSTLVDLSDTTTWMTEFIALFVGNPVEAHDMSEADFYSNGYGALSDAIIAYAEEELNGLFEFYMEYDSEGALADELKEERIIKAPAQDKLGEQLFRIYSVTKSHDSDRIIVKAQHITYDLANNYVEEFVANNLTKKQAMEKIGSLTVRPHPFVITSSNTTTRSSTRLYRTNPLQMVAGMSGSILQIWGGQIERDNFRLVMHDRRGSDDGVAVTYEKNITGLEATIDISGLVTRIHPFVKVEASDGAPERLIELPDKYIDSPLINAYSQVYIEPLDLSQDERIDVDGKTDAQIRAQIQTVAERYFDETGNDKPKATMDVQFAHLWETEEYRDVAPLELVGMGDTVTVRHSKLGVEASAIVNYIRYNCLAGVNEEVKLGGAKARMSDAISRIERVEERVNEVQDDANRAIVSANGKNKTYYGPDEPDVKAIKGDTWFKVVDGEYTRTYRFDGIQWQLILDMDSHEALAEAEDARQRADDAFDLGTANQVAIQANETAINLRVRKDELLSQINIEAGHILIDSSDKLVLSANTTYVAGDFKLDGSANITDASIGTAQIGTIDAGIASIINLNADNMTSGVLTSQNDRVTFDLNNGFLNINEGAISIKRPDGYKVVNDGMLTGEFVVQPSSPPFMEDGVTIVGHWYSVRSTGNRRVERYNFQHNGRYLRLSLARYVQQGNGAQGTVYAVDGQTNEEIWRITFDNNVNHSAAQFLQDYNIDLGTPTGNRKSIIIRMRTTVTGDAVRLHIGRVSLWG